jgi:hypothetical protein
MRVSNWSASTVVTSTVLFRVCLAINPGAQSGRMASTTVSPLVLGIDPVDTNNADGVSVRDCTVLSCAIPHVARSVHLPGGPDA